MDYQQGSTIRGYTIKERIGGGGFGDVYLANQSFRDVAIKVIKPQLANNPEFIRRFEAEAHLIARLEDPFIVPLYDFWRDPNGAYLVMRYLRNGSLHNLIQKQGALDIEETVSIMDQVTQALYVAHRDNVIHRDIKPGNILLDEFNRAYLADFGIAKDYNVTQGATTPDDIIGSPDYMSPEQARSEPVTPRTDIYSLGVVLYEMLMGEHPFPNLTVIERMYKHLNEPLPDISVLDNDIRSAVNAVIQKATAKDPDHRFKDVLEMAQALREAARLDVAGATATIVELLTPREQEVLKFIIEGKSNRQIADKLVIEISTVKSFVNQIYRKLRVRSRQQAIVKGRELDLIVGRDASPTTGLGSQLPELKNPYKGLRAFEAADALHFFGRERLTKKLMSRLEGRGRDTRFLAVVGPSGSGKSSLIRAGLIPALYRGGIPGSDQWYVVDMLPGQHPLDELEIALINKVATDRNLNLREQLSRDERGLIRAANLVLPDDNSELLLVIDQFEEVFTLVEDERDRLHFLKILQEAVTNSRSRVRVIVTLRADYYDRPLQYPDFGELMRSRVETVLPLSVEELEQAVREPAHQVGVHYEDGLVARIVADVHYQPGALPLLQYALTELFERRDGRTLTQEAYEAIGGTGGALANRADEIFLEFSAEAQELTRQMFLRLVTLGEGAEDTRRRTLRSELLDIASDPEMMDEVIDLYASSRLLSLSNDGETRQPTVEVAHEAILREWERLREWLNLNREDIRQERLIAHAAEAWESNNRDISYLLTGARLEQAEIWRETTEMVLTPLEREFIQAAIIKREAEQQAEAERQAREVAQERRSRTLLRALVAVFALAAVLSGGFGLYANDQRVRAEASEQEALRQASIGLAAQAVAELQGETPERSVLLSLEALENYPYTPQAETVLAQTISVTRPYRDLITNGTIEAVSFSHDGKLVAANGFYDAVIWDGDSSETEVIGDSYPDPTKRPFYTDVDWSPDGTAFAIVAASLEGPTIEAGRIKVWDQTSGELLHSWVGHETEDIWTVDWSHDGEFIVTGGADDLIRFWNVDTYDQLQTLSGHTDNILDVKLTSDDTYLASASSDTTIRIWNIRTGETLHLLSGHLGAVNVVHWSPDGNRLLSAGDDGLTIIWDANSGDILQTFVGHTGAVLDADWSPDGSLIATASDDGTTRVWELLSGSAISTFRGTSRTLAWSPDGSTLVVGFGVSSLRAWDMSKRPLRLVGHDSFIVDAHWTPDGSKIITGSFDGTARVWDATTGENTLTFRNHIVEGEFSVAGDIHISADSQWAVTQGGDNTTRIWNIETGEERFMFPVFGGNVFSPDGSKLLIFAEREAMVIDWESGETLLAFDPGFEEFCHFIRMSWSSDGRYVSTPCQAQGRVDIWDVRTGEHVRTVSSHDGSVMTTNFSPDGTRLLTTDDTGIVHIWDVVSGKLLFDFKGHTAIVWDAEWSADSKRIASADETGIIRIWDSNTGQEVNRMTVDISPINLNWSADGSHLVVVGFGSFVPEILPVWESTEELIDHAYECCVWRELTSEERIQFGLPIH